MVYRAGVLLVGLALAGCSSQSAGVTSRGDESGAAHPECVEGTQSSCGCPDGEDPGVQVCGADGAYGPCQGCVARDAGHDAARVGVPHPKGDAGHHEDAGHESEPDAGHDAGRDAYVCVPATPQQACLGGLNCGEVSDGCGGKVSCWPEGVSSCPLGQGCGVVIDGRGPNVCVGCAPDESTLYVECSSGTPYVCPYFFGDSGTEVVFIPAGCVKSQNQATGVCCTP